MYAIIQLGSSQYKVSQGDTIEAQLIGKKDGAELNIDQVLFFSDGRTVKVGQPFLKDVKVTATVVSHLLGEKAVSFKHRRRKNSKWTKGHRQKLNALHITKISAGKE